MYAEWIENTAAYRIGITCLTTASQTADAAQESIVLLQEFE